MNKSSTRGSSDQRLHRDCEFVRTSRFNCARQERQTRTGPGLQLTPKPPQMLSSRLFRLTHRTDKRIALAGAILTQVMATINAPLPVHRFRAHLAMTAATGAVAPLLSRQLEPLATLLAHIKAQRSGCSQVLALDSPLGLTPDIHHLPQPRNTHIQFGSCAMPASFANSLIIAVNACSWSVGNCGRS